MTTPQGRKRGPYRVGIERRRAIVEQASETFAQNGFHGSTMRDVADRVGVTPAALTRYYDSKEELFAAVLDYHLDQWRRFVDEAAGANRRGLAYIRALPKVIEYLEDHPGTARILVNLTAEGSDPAHPAHPKLASSQRRTRESFSKHVAEAVVDGEIPAFGIDRIHLEAAQIAVALSGAADRVAVQSGIPPTAEYPPASRVFAAFIEGTISRWQAMRAFETGPAETKA